MEEETKKYAMIGYYPNEVSGGVYAVGNEGVTTQEAKELAAEEGLNLFQLFPLQGKETGQHQFYSAMRTANISMAGLASSRRGCLGTSGG